MAGRIPEQKVILLGDFGVGKTSLFRRFTNNTFCVRSDRKSTLGLDFYTKAFNCHEDVVKIQLWDTGGMERVASITSSYYKFAEAAILVFDMNNPDTFHSLAQHLLEVGCYAENCKVFLCGNKSDLVVQREEHASSTDSALSEQVCVKDMEQFCEQTNTITNMYVTSCKHNTGVTEMFEDIAKQVKCLSRSRYEIAKHSLQNELPFQLHDHDDVEDNDNNCGC